MFSYFAVVFDLQMFANFSFYLIITKLLVLISLIILDFSIWFFSLFTKKLSIFVVESKKFKLWDFHPPETQVLKWWRW